VAVIGLIAVVGWSASRESGPTTDNKRWEPATAEDRVCDQFMKRRKAGDPEASALLGANPVQPEGEVTALEGERLQTDFFLRDPSLQIRGIRRTPEVGQYVLVTQGNVAAPRLQIRRNDDVSSEQRTMTNPDLFVEVRDGKIFGIRATLHHD
jgi:hypothetical protein